MGLSLRLLQRLQNYVAEFMRLGFHTMVGRTMKEKKLVGEMDLEPSIAL